MREPASVAASSLLSNHQPLRVRNRGRLWAQPVLSDIETPSHLRKLIDDQVDRDWIANRDDAPLENPTLIGVAVNDHFGPDYTLEAYPTGFLSGAVFAIRAMGAIKHRQPQV